LKFPHIAFIGKARSGKDTAAGFLVRHAAYTRVAFADPLKEMALRMDPLIPTAYDRGYRLSVRLSRLVTDVGWEYAKDNYPEVRRILQTAGQAVRHHDEGFWVSVAMDRVAVADSWNLPVVVTDCRYPNEAKALQARGFKLVRILRPALVSADTHESETALDDFPTDLTITNGGTPADLREELRAYLLS
jgi:hypothetical protein